MNRLITDTASVAALSAGLGLERPEMVPQLVQQWQAAAAAQRAPTAEELRMMNMQARAGIMNAGLELSQSISRSSIAANIPGTQINLPFRNVGLIKRFLIEFNFRITPVGAEVLTLTKLGLSNLISNLTLTDLSNSVRINTAGWHLHQLATVRRGSAFGAAFVNDSPIGNASAYGVIKGAATISGATDLRMIYEVPVCYADNDYRGGIYSGVVNATGQLSFTVNPILVAAAGANPTFAMYQSSTAAIGTVSNFNYEVTQVYMDQIPQAQNGAYVLPILDLSTQYLINSTNQPGLVVGQDNPISYSNFREFLSTMLLYDNNGTMNAGTDINRFKLVAANQLSLFDLTPSVVALLTREEIGNDMPAGVHYFNHRRRPINTVQFGNMQLVVNPSSVASASGSVMYIGFESMATQNMVTQAGSLGGRA